MHSYQDIRALDDQYVMQTYKRLPGLFVRGSGCKLWDSEGNEYLDFLAGIAVCSLGHCHPRMVQALTRQAQTLIHTSNHLLTAAQPLLAKKLCEISGMDRAFFAVCGATANETALKIAKKHGLQKRPHGDYEIVSLYKSFHGRTLGTLSATAQEKYQKPFQPLLPGFRHIPANDIEALRDVVGPQTAAVVVEPIQGEGGVTPLTSEFVDEARKLTLQHDALLILDEVQAGIGRTGKWFGYQHYEIEPDLVCLAKALGGGMTIGACLGRGFAATLLKQGEHGSTFGGNALACATALTVLETIEDEGLLERAQTMGRILEERILELGHPVSGVRGRGLMLGIALSEPIGRDLVGECLRRRLIINAPDEHTIRLVPPLIIGEPEINSVIGTLREALTAIHSSAAV